MAKNKKTELTPEELSTLAEMAIDQPGGMEKFWDDNGQETPLTETYAAKFNELSPKLKRLEIDRKRNQRKTAAAEKTRDTPEDKQRKRGETTPVKRARKNILVQKTQRQDDITKSNREKIKALAKAKSYSEEDVANQEQARSAARLKEAQRLGLNTPEFLANLQSIAGMGGKTTGLRYDPDHPKAVRGYVSATTGEEPTEADVIASLWYMGGIPGLDDVNEQLDKGTAPPVTIRGTDENVSGEEFEKDTTGLETTRSMPSNEQIKKAKEGYAPKAGGSEVTRGTLGSAAEIEYAAIMANSPQFGDVSASEQARIDAEDSGVVEPEADRTVRSRGLLSAQFKLNTRYETDEERFERNRTAKGRAEARQADATRLIGSSSVQSTIPRLRKAEQSLDSDINPVAFKDIASGIDAERTRLGLEDAQRFLNENRDVLSKTHAAPRERTSSEKNRYDAELDKITSLKREHADRISEGQIDKDTDFESWRKSKAAKNPDEYGLSHDLLTDSESIAAYIAKEKKNAERAGSPLTITPQQIADPNHPIHKELEKLGIPYEKTRPVATTDDDGNPITGTSATEPIRYNYVAANSTRSGVKTKDGKDEEGNNTKNIIGLGLIKEVVDEIKRSGGEVVKVGEEGGGSYVKRHVTPGRLDGLFDLHDIAIERAIRSNANTANSKGSLGNRDRTKDFAAGEGSGSGIGFDVPYAQRLIIAARTKTGKFIDTSGDPTRSDDFKTKTPRQQRQIVLKATREGTITPQIPSIITNPQFNAVEDANLSKKIKEELIASGLDPETTRFAKTFRKEYSKRSKPRTVTEIKKVKNAEGNFVDEVDEKGNPVPVMRDGPRPIRQIITKALGMNYKAPTTTGPFGRQFTGYEAAAAVGIQKQLDDIGADTSVMRKNLGLSQREVVDDTHQRLVDEDMAKIHKAVEVLNLRRPHVERGVQDAIAIDNVRSKAQRETREALEAGTHVNASGKQTEILTELPRMATDAEKAAHAQLRGVHTRAIIAAGHKAVEEHLDKIASEGSVKRDIRGNTITEEVKLEDGTIIDRPVSAGSQEDVAAAEASNAIRLHIATGLAGLPRKSTRRGVINRTILQHVDNPTERYHTSDSTKYEAGTAKWIDVVDYVSKQKETKNGKKVYKEIALAPIEDKSKSPSSYGLPTRVSHLDAIHAMLDSIRETSPETGEVSYPYGILPSGMSTEALHDLGVSDRTGNMNIPESTVERQKLSLAVRKNGWYAESGTSKPTLGIIERGRRIAAESQKRRDEAGTSEVSEYVDSAPTTSARILPKSAGKGIVEPEGTVTRTVETRREPSQPPAPLISPVRKYEPPVPSLQRAQLSSQFNTTPNMDVYTRAAIEGLKAAEFIKKPIENAPALAGGVHPDDQIKTGDVVTGANLTVRNPLLGGKVQLPGIKQDSVLQAGNVGLSVNGGPISKVIETLKGVTEPGSAGLTDRHRIPVTYDKLEGMLTPQEIQVRERNKDSDAFLHPPGSKYAGGGIYLTSKQFQDRKTPKRELGAASTRSVTDRPLVAGDTVPTGRLANAGQYAKIASKNLKPKAVRETAQAPEAAVAPEEDTNEYAWSGIPASAPNIHLNMNQMGQTTNRVYDPTKSRSRTGREIIPSSINS